MNLKSISSKYKPEKEVEIYGYIEITNPSPGVTAIKKPKVLEVARKDEKSGLTTSCLQTTRPMYSIIFTKAESTPNTTTMTFPLPPKPIVYHTSIPGSEPVHQ